MTTVATVGGNPSGIAFDGSRIWTANFSGSLSIVLPAPSTPWSSTTVSSGFQALAGALYDGSNVWMTDNFAGTLLKLDSSGSILQTVTVSPGPLYPIFDGTNIWVPDTDNSVSVVRATSGAVLATLTGNGLRLPDRRRVRRPESAHDQQHGRQRFPLEGRGPVGDWLPRHRFQYPADRGLRRRNQFLDRPEPGFTIARF